MAALDKQTCPCCKTTRERNISMKFMVNSCGHAICENCVDLRFIRGSGVCPVCGVSLRRINFRYQIFEHAGVEREIEIRRKLEQDFCKREADFPTLLEYNNYLEKVETIIYNLTYGIKLEATQEEVDAYRKENRKDSRKRKINRGDVEVELCLQAEALSVLRRNKDLEKESEIKKLEQRVKEEMLDEIIEADDAQTVIESHQKKLVHELKRLEAPAPENSDTIHFSSGVRMGDGHFLPPPAHVEEAPLFYYVPLQFESYGPVPPTDNTLRTKYEPFVRPATQEEEAGGFRAHLACRRALDSAFCGLFYSASSKTTSAVTV